MVAPAWPKGPIPWVALLGMSVGITGAFIPGARSLPIIKQALEFGTTAFRSLFGYQVVMGAAGAIHLLEALWTARFCAQHKLSSQDTLGWCGITVLIGYVGIHELKRRLKEKAQ